MPGLLRGVARTAVVAGTATAVSNRVSRRQEGRWAQQEQQQWEQQQQAAPPPAARSRSARPGRKAQAARRAPRLGSAHRRGVRCGQGEASQRRLSKPAPRSRLRRAPTRLLSRGPIRVRQARYRRDRRSRADPARARADVSSSPRPSSASALSRARRRPPAGRDPDRCRTRVPSLRLRRVRSRQGSRSSPVRRPWRSARRKPRETRMSQKGHAVGHAPAVAEDPEHDRAAVVGAGEAGQRSPPRRLGDPQSHGGAARCCRGRVR